MASIGFIIIQIGNPQLDELCEKAIVPALKECDLDPKRVDKHNEGGILKSEIIKFIESAEIIIADVTNERPNCYLEIGYAMGIDKFKNLILTAREDHNPDSPRYKHSGPKVHFDLGGYDILFWRPEKPDLFYQELVKRIRRRKVVLAPSLPPKERNWDEEWIRNHREITKNGFSKIVKPGFTPAKMEISFQLSDYELNVSQSQLLEVARNATIRTFGWPIGLVMDREEYRPRPKADGIVAEILVEDRSSYDYWALRRNGDYYVLKSLFEDDRKPEPPGYIFFNTRIVRTTEALLLCARLYSRLEVPSKAKVRVRIAYKGLKGRILTAAGPRGVTMNNRTTAEDQIEAELHQPLSQIESALLESVKILCSPLFMIFDFFQLNDSVYADIVDKFVKGQSS